MTNIFVGNLAYSTDDDELREAFAAHGEVSSARVIMDRESGRSRGFGFVEMPDTVAAAAAIEALEGAMIGGRNVRVNEARGRDDNRGGGGGGGRR